MSEDGLKEFMRNAKDWNIEFPDKVDQSLENMIDNRTENDSWGYSFDSVVVVVSVTDWALSCDANSIPDKRYLAQKKAAETFAGYDLSDIQNECGSKLFEGHEYQPSKEHIQRKWQRMYELMLEDIQTEQNRDF